jgi:hypothetical protein
MLHDTRGKGAASPLSAVSVAKKIKKILKFFSSLPIIDMRAKFLDG